MKNFLRELGSADPTPGGGAAAAMTGALGAALLEMVSRLNKDTASAQKAARMKARFQTLMQKDARAFKKVYALYKKKTSCCSPAYQRALQGAAAAPGEICMLAVEGAALALSQKKKTSRWLISDLKESAILFKACFESARLNVNVNLEGFHDKGEAKKVDAYLNKKYEELIKSGGKVFRG